MSQPTDASSSNPTDDLDDQDSRELDVGDQIFPLAHSDDPLDGTHEIDLGDWGEELNQAVSDDDGEGPLDDHNLDSFDLEGEADNQPQDDESSQSDLLLIEDELPPSESVYPDLGELAEGLEPGYGPGLSDAEIRWSTQPWCERRLVRAFAPRVALVARGNLILATGDSTDVLEMDTFRTLTEAPHLGRTSSAVLLDDRAEEALIGTVTGKLLHWNRSVDSVRVQRAGDGRELDCVLRVCQGASPSAAVWALLSNGGLFYRTADAERFTQHQSRDGYVSITPDESGLAAITRDRYLVRVSEGPRAGLDRIRLPASDEVGALTTRSLFLVSKTLVLLGTRELGAWLSADEGLSFCEIPGCQNMTAATFGTYAGRSYLWVALFRELDDSTELIAIECRSRRAQKLATFTVVADCAGPEDDPPERARIDALYWDSVHQRLWAAGCFGITCFEPPQSTQSSS